jgi:exodeoxyribonuclease VII large subunit
LTRVLLLPVRVQGTEAPAEIAAAIHYANHYNLADLLIVGRGGGSIEDLWAFNEEIVAQAIFQSNIPVISAVGHEPDVTISDYVADLRAATPSNAAELAVPDSNVIRQQLDSFSSTISASLLKQLKTYRQRLSNIQGSSALSSPVKYISLRRDSLMYLKSRLISALEKNISSKKQSYISLTAKLDAMSPLKVLSRGYALAYTDTGSILRSVKQTKLSDTLEIQLQDGRLQATVDKIWEEQR